MSGDRANQQALVEAIPLKLVLGYNKEPTLWTNSVNREHGLWAGGWLGGVVANKGWIGHWPKLSSCRPPGSLPSEQLLAHFGNFQNSILLKVLSVAGVLQIISYGGGSKQAVAMAPVERFNGPSVGWRAALEETNLNPIPPP